MLVRIYVKYHFLMCYELQITDIKRFMKYRYSALNHTVRISERGIILKKCTLWVKGLRWSRIIMKKKYKKLISFVKWDWNGQEK